MNKTLMGIAVLSLLFTACGDKKEQAEAPRELQLRQMPEGHPDVSSAGETSVAGVQWTLPSNWTVGAQRQMRVATYNIPAAGGDTENAECAVFHFGSGQGGDVQMNIDRWVGQFEKAKGPEQSTNKVNGLDVTMVKIAGTYLAPGGPMMQSSGKFDNYRLLGAIVAAPEGSVFFKLTGPAKTVGVAEGDFNTMVASLTK